MFLFGFSRGAFTVRALAGMLNRCGLLEKGSVNLVPYASRIYNWMRLQAAYELAQARHTQDQIKVEHYEPHHA